MVCRHRIFEKDSLEIAGGREYHSPIGSRQHDVAIERENVLVHFKAEVLGRSDTGVLSQVRCISVAVSCYNLWNPERQCCGIFVSSNFKSSTVRTDQNHLSLDNA